MNTNIANSQIKQSFFESPAKFYGYNEFEYNEFPDIAN